MAESRPERQMLRRFSAILSAVATRSMLILRGGSTRSCRLEPASALCGGVEVRAGGGALGVVRLWMPAEEEIEVAALVAV